jgi:nitrite reductase (NADH) small subunit
MSAPTTARPADTPGPRPTTTQTARPHALVRVCDVDDVPQGEGRALTVDGRRIALFRADSGWYALDNACPHAGGPLADGILADCRVICPLHERAFDLATGAALAGGASVAAHEVEVRGDEVYVRLLSASAR